MENQVTGGGSYEKVKAVVRTFFEALLFLLSLDFVLTGIFVLWKSLSPLFEKDGSGLMAYPIFLALVLPVSLSLMATGMAMFFLLYFINKFSKHKKFVIGLSITLLTIVFLSFLVFSTLNTFFSDFALAIGDMWKIFLFKLAI